MMIWEEAIETAYHGYPMDELEPEDAARFPSLLDVLDYTQVHGWEGEKSPTDAVEWAIYEIWEGAE